MPRPYGGDRLEPLDGGRFRISSPRAKGWRARRPGSLTAPEFPGTAVAWDGAIWEVVSAVEPRGGASSYVLAPWKDEHAIRVTVDYDSRSERVRAAELEKETRRRKWSAGIAASGLLAGLLPSHVQKEIESEYGFLATRLTILSIVTQLAFAAGAIVGIPIEELEGPKWPWWVVALGFLAMAEVMLRSWYTLTRGLPIGSIEGLLAWYVAITVSPRARALDRGARRNVARQRATASVLPPGDFERERDAFTMREPFLALLPADAQLRLAATFGFDPMVWGRRTAATVALIAGTGVVSSMMKIEAGNAGSGTWLSLALAGFLVVEQVRRFATVRSGKPAESVLGIFVRPFCETLLVMEPRALEKGSTEKRAMRLPEVWDGAHPDGDDQTGR